MQSNVTQQRVPIHGDPGHWIHVSESPRHVRVFFGGETIADSKRAKLPAGEVARPALANVLIAGSALGGVSVKKTLNPIPGDLMSAYRYPTTMQNIPHPRHTADALGNVNLARGGPLGVISSKWRAHGPKGRPDAHLRLGGRRPELDGCLDP